MPPSLYFQIDLSILTAVFCQVTLIIRPDDYENYSSFFPPNITVKFIYEFLMWPSHPWGFAYLAHLLHKLIAVGYKMALARRWKLKHKL